MAKAVEKFAEFKKAYEEAKISMLEKAGAAFKELVSDIFKQFPDLKSFGWTQFTPYFNDGDTCSFRVYTNNIYINDPGFDDELNDGEELSYERYKKIEKVISQFLKDVDDDILFDMYGDHSKITIRRDGTAEIEEYEHE